MRLTIVLLLFVSFAFSQTNDSQLAYQYYQSAEYEKAIEIYETLSQGSNFSQYYTPYFQSLVLSNNLLEAKKLAQKMIKRSKQLLTLHVDLYMVYVKLDEKINAQTLIDKIHFELEKKQHHLVSVSNAFIKYSFYQQALDCYHIIEQLNRDRNLNYNIQKAQLYQYLNQDQLMIEEYLSYLQNNPSQKNTIINYLQRYLDNNGIDNNSNYSFVKNGLLKYSQNENDTYIFSELLIWFFMNQNDFNFAYLQAKSLDIRLNEDGKRLYYLAENFLDNQYFDLAIKCYQYIINKGDSYYYIDAHINMLFALGEKENANMNEIDDLYKKTIKELGENYSTILLLNNYAYFKAFSLNDLQSSKDILERSMNIPNISRSDLAECKLVYADVMLLSGNIWTSLLYYSQVEKDFKENPLGHEAKLRRAKISYYQGDFEWAQSQLDVLKSSTSKLISNDAMYLSLLITDNLNMDTSVVPMEMYARADLLFYQNRFEKSVATLDSILTTYSGHPLVDEIYFRKFKIYIELKQIKKSVEMLDSIVSYYSFDILYDDALFNLANIYETKLVDVEKAAQYYEKILLECGGSIYTSESRKKYRQLRGDDL